MAKGISKDLFHGGFGGVPTAGRMKTGDETVPSKNRGAAKRPAKGGMKKKGKC